MKTQKASVKQQITEGNVPKVLGDWTGLNSRNVYDNKNNSFVKTGDACDFDIDGFRIFILTRFIGGQVLQILVCLGSPTISSASQAKSSTQCTT